MKRLSACICSLMVLLLLKSCAKDKIMEGIQGEWKVYVYKSEDNEGNIYSSTADIRVVNSYYKVISERIYVYVDWEVRNTDKEPATFNWDNKYLLDEEECVYAPYTGEKSRLLQPHDVSNELRVCYKISNAVKIDSLWWGLRYEGGKHKYKIKLNPVIFKRTGINTSNETIQKDKSRPQHAKDFSLSTLDGDNIKLSELKGNVVLVDFWATWCPPCKQSIPAIERLYNKYHDRGFVVLGISAEGKSILSEYQKKHNITYSILIDNVSVMKQYGVKAIPNLVIIDKKGMIRKNQEGWAPEIESGLEKLIEELLNE